MFKRHLKKCLSSKWVRNTSRNEDCLTKSILKYDFDLNSNILDKLISKKKVQS